MDNIFNSNSANPNSGIQSNSNTEISDKSKITSNYGPAITNLTPTQFGAGAGSAGSPQNLTTQTWGNQVPFSDEQLRNMSGTQRVPSPEPQQMIPSSAQMPETLTNPIYTPGYLRTQIGKWMRVEFLIGGITTDRVGRLIDVGASYIILQSLEANSKMLCDIYSIKFVTIIDNVEMAGIYSSVYNND